MIAWTDAFLASPAPVPPEVRERLAAHFEPEEIVELTAGIALFMGFSKIAIAMGGLPDEMPTIVVPTPSLPVTDDGARSPNHDVREDVREEEGA